MIKATFLGTTCTAPTKERGHPAVHLKYLGHNMLFDCGEGAQRQLMLAGISPFKIGSIFITHLHADHLLGLGGLIQTMSFWGRENEVCIYGPKGIGKFVEFYEKWPYFKCGFPIKVKELVNKTAKVVHKTPDYKIMAFPVKHSCPCYGYVFEEVVEVNLDKKKLKKLGLYGNKKCRELKEKGKIRWKGHTVKLEDVTKPSRRPLKVVYCMDTNPLESIVKNVEGADLLICEGTFSDELREKAHEYGHMTVKDAARIAKKANVAQLIITHFSPRYENTDDLKKQAQSIFRNTIVAKDLMEVEI